MADIRPSIVRAEERRVALATAGMQREEAYADDERWLGFVRTDADIEDGWHHHGERGPAIQDGGHEIAHDAGHRLDPCRVPVDRPVGSDTEDRNGNREPPEELRQLDQLRLVARPEGVGERDDVRVIALVDLPGGRGLDTQAVRFQLHTGAPRTFWTVATVDDALAAHFEHTIAITANGAEILTQV